MTQNKNQIIFIIILCLNFFPTSGFKWIDPKEFNFKKCSSNGSKVCVFEDGLEYPKELRELHDDYHLSPDKTEIK